MGLTKIDDKVPGENGALKADAADASDGKSKRIGDRLVEQGIISLDQLQVAFREGDVHSEMADRLMARLK